ncbi:membrane-associated phospholipid phosphatase [Sphingomonas sp. PvP055]|uniref:phosphatase PAP2 family protein n=1 Tax=Sphingomonas sp. PvP055 TaxID=3156391 RepID=UPI0033962553
MKTPLAQTTDAGSWWLIGAMALVCFAVSFNLGFHVRPASMTPLGIGLVLLYAGYAIGSRTGRARLANGAIAFLQMTLFTAIGVVLSYALAAHAAPLWDDVFAAADRRLGFDWHAIFAVADRSPALLWIGGVAYHSLTLQMIVCIVALAATDRIGTLRTTVAAAILTGFATILISAFMPALGNVFDPAAYHLLWPSVAWIEQDMLLGLRDGSWRTVDLTQLMGIVSFPSYHATLAVILAWAQRDLRGWRVAATVWAGVTILATPLFGGHYGVDVLAGLAMAVLGLAVAPGLARLRANVQENPRATAGQAG